MIKVTKHGRREQVLNPSTGVWQDMTVVTWQEYGRGTTNKQLSNTSDYLSSLVGENVGFEGVRTHSQLVPTDKLKLFPVDKDFPGHINRILWSEPQMGQQENVDAQIVDGKPTYFTTVISGRPEEDVDMRVSLELIYSKNPSALFNGSRRRTEVRELDENGKVLGATRTPLAEPSIQ